MDKNTLIRIDIIKFGQILEESLYDIYRILLYIGQRAGSVSTVITNDALSSIVGAVINIVVVSAIAVVLILLTGTAIVKYLKFYRDHQLDEESAFVGVVILAVLVFLTEEVKQITDINVITIMISAFLIYSALRCFWQMNNREARDAVLIFSGIVVGTIGGMAILVHFFGAWAIFGVPAGLIIAMDSKR